MHGLLDLTFERNEERTILSGVRRRAPLRIIRPFYPEGAGPAHLFLLNVTAGILEGDRIETTLRLGKEAHAVVTSPAATRVHPSPSGETSQRLEIRLAPRAILEYLPEPLLLYAGASFRQEIEIALEEGAILFYTDLLAPGRLGRGESFAYRRYESFLQIKDSEGILVQERFRLSPMEEPLDVVGVMEEYSHLGTLYLFCPEEARAPLLSLFRSIEAKELFWGTSLLPRRGLAVRALAHDTPSIQDFFLSSGACFEESSWDGPFLPSENIDRKGFTSANC